MGDERILPILKMIFDDVELKGWHDYNGNIDA